MPSRPRNARFSRPNGCRSAPTARSPGPATSCRPRSAAGASSACATRKAPCASCAMPAGIRTCRWWARRRATARASAAASMAGPTTCRAGSWARRRRSRPRIRSRPIFIWRRSPSAIASGLVFFSLAARGRAARSRRPAAGLRRHAHDRDRLQLEGLRRASAGRAHAVAGLRLALAAARGAARRAGDDHGAGRAAHLPAHAAVSPTCSAAHADDTQAGRRHHQARLRDACRPTRNEGKPAADGALVATFHRQLADAYAQDRTTT